MVRGILVVVGQQNDQRRALALDEASRGARVDRRRAPRLNRRPGIDHGEPGRHAEDASEPQAFPRQQGRRRRRS